MNRRQRRALRRRAAPTPAPAPAVVEAPAPPAEPAPPSAPEPPPPRPAPPEPSGTPLDRARSYREVMDRNGWSARTLAGVLGLHHGTVSRLVRLLTLPPRVAGLVEAGTLRPTVARELQRVTDPSRLQALAARAASERWTRAQTVAAVRRVVPPARALAAPKVSPPAPAEPDRPRRVFAVPGGRVVVELDAGLSRNGLIDAVIAAATALRSEPLTTTAPPRATRPPAFSARAPDPDSSPSHAPRPDP